MYSPSPHYRIRQDLTYYYSLFIAIINNRRNPRRGTLIPPLIEADQYILITAK